MLLCTIVSRRARKDNVSDIERQLVSHFGLAVEDTDVFEGTSLQCVVNHMADLRLRGIGIQQVIHSLVIVAGTNRCIVPRYRLRHGNDDVGVVLDDGELRFGVLNHAAGVFARYEVERERFRGNHVVDQSRNTLALLDRRRGCRKRIAVLVIFGIYRCHGVVFRNNGLENGNILAPNLSQLLRFAVFHVVNLHIMEELNDGFLVVILQTAVALEFRELGIVVNYQFERSVLFHTAGNQIGVDRAACTILRTDKGTGEIAAQILARNGIFGRSSGDTGACEFHIQRNGQRFAVSVLVLSLGDNGKLTGHDVLIDHVYNLERRSAARLDLLRYERYVLLGHLDCQSRRRNHESSFDRGLVAAFVAAQIELVVLTFTVNHRDIGKSLDGNDIVRYLFERSRNVNQRLDAAGEVCDSAPEIAELRVVIVETILQIGFFQVDCAAVGVEQFAVYTLLDHRLDSLFQSYVGIGQLLEDRIGDGLAHFGFDRLVIHVLSHVRSEVVAEDLLDGIGDRSRLRRYGIGDSGKDLVDLSRRQLIGTGDVTFTLDEILHLLLGNVLAVDQSLLDDLLHFGLQFTHGLVRSDHRLENLLDIVGSQLILGSLFDQFLNVSLGLISLSLNKFQHLIASQPIFQIRLLGIVCQPFVKLCLETAVGNERREIYPV